MFVNVATSVFVLGRQNVVWERTSWPVCLSPCVCVCVSGVFTSGLLRGHSHGPFHARKQSVTCNRSGAASLCSRQT